MSLELVDAFVSIGTNLGDRLGTIEAALVVLDDLDVVTVVDVSGVYETAPWGGVEQDPYLNACVRVATTLTPHELLAELLATEEAFGRDRATEVRWGPRVLDLDLLLYGDQVIDETPTLVVPHPRLAERAFVLVPLLEVFAGGALPDGRRIARMLGEMAPVEGIELFVRLAELPGTDRSGIARPEGPRAPAAVQAPDWAGAGPGQELDR